MALASEVRHVIGPLSSAISGHMSRTARGTSGWWMGTGGLGGWVLGGWVGGWVLGGFLPCIVTGMLACVSMW